MSDNDSPDSRDITSGAGDTRFDEVDDGTDYTALADEWDGDPAQAEVVLDAISSEGIETEAGDPPAVEGTVETAVGKLPKRFVLREPDTKAAVDALVGGLLNANEFAVCTTVVDKPPLTRERYEKDLTELERTALYDLCASFVRAEELIDPRILEQVSG